MSAFNQGKTVVFFTFLCYLSLMTSDAWAYIDPGNGSYLFQLMVAGFVGFVFTFRIYLAKIKSFLQKYFSKKRK